MARAASEQRLINALYALAPLNENCFASAPTTDANPAIATTVPTPYAARYAAACPGDGNASAGKTPRKCELPARPCSVPTANAACVCVCGARSACACAVRWSCAWICAWLLPPCECSCTCTWPLNAFRNPHSPIPINTTPTNRSAHDDSQCTGRSPRSSNESKPTTITPLAWPNPQRTPLSHAFSRSSTDNGAMAAKWSGPEKTWINPATNPVTRQITTGPLRWLGQPPPKT